MIHQASVYDRDPPAGLRVLVMRYWPRGIRRDRVDAWLRDAAPSRELVDAYMHHGLPWAEFDARYRAEIQARPDVLTQLRALEREHGSLVLLCHERIPPAEHCHRQILADLLETVGDVAPRA